MNRKQLLGFAVFALLGALIGCGGGGGVSGTGSTATTGATVGTTGGALTLMSDSQRYTVISSITTALAGVPQTDGQWNPSLAATALSKVSGLTNVEVAPNGDVIALFSDGVPFSLFSGQPMPQSPQIPPPAENRVSQLRPSTIPGGQSATILDTMEPVLAGGQSSAQLAAMLTKVNYTVTTNTATIAALENLGNSNTSFFLFHGHGGECYQPQSLTNGKRAASRGFGLQTSIAANFNKPSAGYNAPTYENQLSAGDLGVAISNYDFAKDTSGNIIPNTFLQVPFFFITSQFVHDYHWKFTPGSLVFLSCCDGNSSDATAFHAALTQAGAAAIAGWTNETQPAMMNAAQGFFVDRMTGGNVIQPVTPPRRPFPFADCKVVEDAAGITSYTLPTGLGPTQLTLTPSSTSFQALAPALDAMANDDNNGKLNLLGVFGSTQGSVFLGGTKLAVNQWTNNSITCVLPPTLSGNCYVQVPYAGGSRNSNTRELTKWTGTVTDTQVEGGSQIAQATLNLTLRASISPYYLNPGSTTLTLAPSAGAFSVPDPLSCFLVSAGNNSTCKVTAGGDFDSGGANYRLTYSGPSSIQASGSNLNYWSFAMGVPITPGGPGRFGFHVFTSNSLEVFIQNQDGSTSSSTTSQGWQSYRQVGANNVGDIVTNFDGSYNMQAGSSTSNTGLTETTTWSTLSCTSPPSTSSTVAR